MHTLLCTQFTLEFNMSNTLTALFSRQEESIVTSNEIVNYISNEVKI